MEFFSELKTKVLEFGSVLYILDVLIGVIYGEVNSENEEVQKAADGLTAALHYAESCKDAIYDLCEEGYSRAMKEATQNE